jgi:hypothetical protein
VFLEAIQVVVEVEAAVVTAVELWVQVMVLVQKRVEWGLQVQLEKNYDGLEVLCCFPLVTMAWAFVEWILVVKQRME